VLQRTLRHLTGQTRYVTLPLYLKWDERDVTDILQKNIGWKGPEAVTLEHTDCIAGELKEYLRIKEFGFSEKTQKFSVLLRNKYMNRDEALDKARAFETAIMTDSSGNIKNVLQKLDLSEAELASAILRRQLPYIPFFARFLEKENLMKRLYYRF
jgi:hypothetical protein